MGAASLELWCRLFFTNWDCKWNTRCCRNAILYTAISRYVRCVCWHFLPTSSPVMALWSAELTHCILEHVTKAIQRSGALCYPRRPVTVDIEWDIRLLRASMSSSTSLESCCRWFKGHTASGAFISSSTSLWSCYHWCRVRYAAPGTSISSSTSLWSCYRWYRLRHTAPGASISSSTSLGSRYRL